MRNVFRSIGRLTKYKENKARHSAVCYFHCFLLRCIYLRLHIVLVCNIKLLVISLFLVAINRHEDQRNLTIPKRARLELMYTFCFS